MQKREKRVESLFFDELGRKRIINLLVGDEPKERLEKDSKNLFIIIFDIEWDHYSEDVISLKEKVEKWSFNSQLDVTIKTWNKNKVSSQILVKFVEKFCEKFKKKLIKVIIYYTGHGRCVGMDKYSSFNNEYGDQNTFDIYQRINALKDTYKKLCLNIFIADCCSIQDNGLKKKVFCFEGIEKKISFFDFVGNYYIRTSQLGCRAYGDTEFGNYFIYTLIKFWDGNWYDIVEYANRFLFGIQIATGEGNVILSINRKFEPKELKLNGNDDFSLVENEKKRKRDDKNDEEEEDREKKNQKTK